MVSTQLQRNSSDTFGQTSFLVITATRTVGSEIVKQLSIKNTSSSCSHTSNNVDRISKYHGVETITGFDYEMPETHDALPEGNAKLDSCFPIPPPDQNIIESTQMFIKKVGLKSPRLSLPKSIWRVPKFDIGGATRTLYGNQAFLRTLIVCLQLVK
jgi:hypothetical protein